MPHFCIRAPADELRGLTLLFVEAGEDGGRGFSRLPGALVGAPVHVVLLGSLQPHLRRHGGRRGLGLGRALLFASRRGLDLLRDRGLWLRRRCHLDGAAGGDGCKWGGGGDSLLGPAGALLSLGALLRSGLDEEVAVELGLPLLPQNAVGRGRSVVPSQHGAPLSDGGAVEGVARLAQSALALGRRGERVVAGGLGGLL